MVLQYRHDPLKGVRVIISSDRAKRPSQTDATKPVTPVCPFCPGSEGMTPPTTFALPKEKDWKVRAFRNKFAIVKPEGKFREGPKGDGKNLLWSSPGWGDHEVIVETPLHDQLFQHLDIRQLERALAAYKHRFRALCKLKGVKSVYLFKNHGRASGASINHEHSQIIALPFVPDYLERESKSLKKTDCAMCASVKEAQGDGRIISQTKHFVAFTPFSPRFPDEFWLASKQHVNSFLAFTKAHDREFLKLLHHCVSRAIEESVDYTIAYHNAPLGKGDYHFHLEVYPRPNVWGGIEIGTGLIVNSKDPRQAVKELRHPGPG